MPVCDYNEYCNRCGESVKYTGWSDYNRRESGGFFGRKWDEDSVFTRRVKGRKFPKGDFICKECQ